MRSREIAECVEIFARHPVLAPRYGDVIAQLGEAWSRLLGQSAFAAFIFEESTGEGTRAVGVGARAFITDAFVVEMKTAPLFWAGPELTQRILRGNSPVLSDKEVRKANTDGGLNLFVWDGTASARDVGRHEILHGLFAEFFDQHRGFLLKELIAQASNADMLEAQLHSGGLLVDELGCYSNRIQGPVTEIASKPHYVGVSRELAIRQYGSWVSSLFIYNPPRFSFRSSEQRLLLLAFSGATDEQLSRDLGISVSAVKKCWQQIYGRVAECAPELVPDTHLKGERASERGRTKKTRLLAYLREHMEELRPGASNV